MRRLFLFQLKHRSQRGRLVASAPQIDLIPEEHTQAFPNMIFLLHFCMCVFLKMKGSYVISEGIMPFLGVTWLGKAHLSTVEQIKAIVGSGRAYLLCPCLRFQHCHVQHSGHVPPCSLVPKPQFLLIVLHPLAK